MFKLKDCLMLRLLIQCRERIVFSTNGAGTTGFKLQKCLIPKKKKKITHHTKNKKYQNLTEKDHQ